MFAWILARHERGPGRSRDGRDCGRQFAPRAVVHPSLEIWQITLRDERMNQVERGAVKSDDQYPGIHEVIVHKNAGTTVAAFFVPRFIAVGEGSSCVHKCDIR